MTDFALARLTEPGVARLPATSQAELEVQIHFKTPS